MNFPELLFTLNSSCMFLDCCKYIDDTLIGVFVTWLGLDGIILSLCHSTTDFAICYIDRKSSVLDPLGSESGVIRKCLPFMGAQKQPSSSFTMLDAFAEISGIVDPFEKGREKIKITIKRINVLLCEGCRADVFFSDIF
jgi:hypothetical protein